MFSDVIRYYRVDPEEISYIGDIVHAYDGIGVVRTMDSEKGIIEILTTPDMIGELEALIRELKKEIAIEERILPEERDPVPSMDGRGEPALEVE